MFYTAKNDTLRARGVCSRIPHPRHISRDSHGQLSTHVYIAHIIPFLGCPPHSTPTTAAIPHPSSDRSTSCDLAAQGSSRCSSGNLIATRQANLAARPTASGDMRSSLIVPANNSITIIPLTTPYNPLLNPVNPVNPVQNFYTFYTAKGAVLPYDNSLQ